MKNLRKSYAAKLIAVILLCVSAIVCVASAGGAFALYEAGAYGMSYDAAAGQMLDGIGSNMCRAAAAGWRTDSYEGSARPANFRCVIFNAEGEEVYSDYEGEDTLWEKTMTVPPEYFFWSEERPAASDAAVTSPMEEISVSNVCSSVAPKSFFSSRNASFFHGVSPLILRISSAIATSVRISPAPNASQAPVVPMKRLRANPASAGKSAPSISEMISVSPALPDA